MIDKYKVGGLALGLEGMHRRAKLAASVLEASEGAPILEAAGELIARKELATIRSHLREWLTYLDGLEFLK